MLTEQECTEVAEKVWEVRWRRCCLSSECSNIPEDRAAFAEKVNSYEGMGRTLEAMREKGFIVETQSTPKGSACVIRPLFVGDFTSPLVYFEADAPDLPTAVHRAALAALR